VFDGGTDGGDDGAGACEEGYVDDCSGDGDCCPEDWIGDGEFCDDAEQTSGCDLSCYDNDGGDCDIITLSIPLIAGYNWISFNVVPEDNSLSGILGSLGTDANFVASQSDGVSNNYGDYGWYGSLAELSSTQMYKLDMLAPATLTISGIPVDVNATPISLIAGYNWIGYLPQNPGALDVALESLGTDANFVASQSDGVSNNYGDYGWYGSLAELSSTQMYKLDMLAPATLTISGIPVDVNATPISLIAGYNWIGYLPQNPGALDVALESLGTDANFVASQSDGVSNNYGDYGWYGSLATLEPGKGYLLEMLAAGNLIYPEFDGLARLALNKQAVLLTETISDWDFNYGDYRYIGAVTLSIENRVDNDGDVVGVFVGDECRGIAERMYFPFDDSYMYIVQVYSNIEKGEELTFKYYDSLNDEVVEYDETLIFEES
jgi:hypothetical protein